MTIVGTRPELIKLSRVIAVLDDCVDHILVHTGQNYDYELNGIFFKEMGIREPDYYLDTAAKNPSETVANVIKLTDELLVKIKPDAILILGDTNSCLAVYPAKRRKIPIFHIEAGNRCFDFRVPEEINRRIVDHLSDINMVHTEHARRYLLAEGLPPDQIIKTGSPLKEILTYHQDEINSSNIMNKLGLQAKKYFVVSMHREENVDNPDNFENLVQAINTIALNYKYPVIFSCHPRTKIKLESKMSLVEGIQVLPPLGFFDYVCLQKNAYCVISDSGTITGESSILGFPAITIRQAHERPEGMDEGIVVMAGVHVENILDAIELTTKQFQSYGRHRIIPEYDVPQISWKVTKIILSYINFINRKVWYK